MTIMETIRKDSITARKARDTVAGNLLSTLLGEATMVGKNNGNRETTNEEATPTVKKFLDNAKETRDIMMKGGVNPTEINREIEILEGYMPSQLTEDELRVVIKNFKEYNYDGATMGNIMKYLQTNFNGRYDGKLASQIAKEA